MLQRTETSYWLLLPNAEWRLLGVRKDVPMLGIYTSRAFFCPHCGEIWGRVTQAEKTLSPHPKWIVETKPCAEHGDGTFLTVFQTAEEFPCGVPPQALLEHDFLALMNLWRQRNAKPNTAA